MRTYAGKGQDTGDHAERIRVLSSYGWLAEMTPEFRTAVIAEGCWKRLEAGDRVITAGDARAELVVLAEGVATLTSSFGYAETPLVHVFRPPFWFGYAPFVGSGPRRFTATMRSTGWTMSINGQRLTGLLDREPGGWPSIVRLAMKYGDLAATIAGDLMIRESQRRVIAILLRCSGRRDLSEGPPLDKVPVTQGELADAANLSRNSVVTILQALAARDLVELNRGYIGIRDHVGLFTVLDDDHWRPGGGVDRARGSTLSGSSSPSAKSLGGPSRDQV